MDPEALFLWAWSLMAGASGARGLVKTGGGTLTLKGNNNYGGSALIEQGVRALDVSARNRSSLGDDSRAKGFCP